MDPFYIFGLEHNISINGDYEIAVADVWIPQSFVNPAFPKRHDIPLLAVEASQPLSSYSLADVQNLQCVYFTPHESITQFQLFRALYRINQTQVSVKYNTNYDMIALECPKDSPAIRLWLHETFAQLVFRDPSSLGFLRSFLDKITIEDEPYYVFDSQKFPAIKNTLQLASYWTVKDELPSLKPSHLLIKCFETKTPQCALLYLGSNSPSNEKEIECSDIHGYQHFAIKHPTFHPLLGGTHTKLTFSLENLLGEQVQLCSQGPPVVMKVISRKTMHNSKVAYFEGKNGDELCLSQPLVNNTGRSLYQIGLSSLSFSTKYPLGLTEEERKITFSCLSPKIIGGRLLKYSITCPEALASIGELARHIEYNTNGVLGVNLTPKLKIYHNDKDAKISIVMPKKLFNILGGKTDQPEETINIELEGYTFACLPRLPAIQPVYVESTLARNGLLKILPIVASNEDGIAHFDFESVDYYPMSVDSVAKLDISLKNSKGELLPMKEKVVATFQFKKVGEVIPNKYHKCV